MQKTNKNNRQKRKLSTKQKVAVIFASVFGFFIITVSALYFIVGHYAFAFALNATVAPSTKSPVEVAEDVSDFDIQYPNTNSDWFKQVEIVTRNIKSDDGYKLVAYQILAENSSDKWFISVHGYRGNASEAGLYAQYFHDEGYNVLLPDLEGHGHSEGKYIGMGYDDRKDIIKWINLIIETNKDAQIVLHGVSMGGATVLMTTGEDLPSNVKVAISDCAYTNVREEFLYLVDEYLDLPFKHFIMSGANTMSRLKTGVSFDQINVVNAVKMSTTPTLFIHGKEDRFVPFYMLEKLYKANDKIEKEKLEVEGAHHAMSATIETETYFKTVFDFVDRFIEE